jgi:hypothetical protein
MGDSAPADRTVISSAYPSYLTALNEANYQMPPDAFRHDNPGLRVATKDTTFGCFRGSLPAVQWICLARRWARRKGVGSCFCLPVRETPMTLPDIRITSEIFWLCALVTALIDVGLVLFLARRIRPDRYRRLHWAVVLAAAVFWVTYGLLLFAMAWESYYAKFLPNLVDRSLVRSLLELLIYPPIGLVLWWLALRLPGNSTVSFCGASMGWACWSRCRSCRKPVRPLWSPLPCPSIYSTGAAC